MEQKEKRMEIKQTFSNVIKEEIPEMTQEEAIKNYRENDTIVPKKNTNNSDDSDDNTEESEHLKRIKQELLASLERVKQLAKKLENEGKNRANIKVKEKQQYGKGKSKQLEQSERIVNKEESEKER